jgi:hypothetical protein
MGDRRPLLRFLESGDLVDEGGDVAGGGSE